MLCPQCGYYSEKNDIVCPECGRILDPNGEARETGAEAIRQGKRAREAALSRTRAEAEEKRRRRSGASHAAASPVTVTVQDTRERQEEYTVSEERAEKQEGIERRRRTIYDDTTAAREKAAEYAQRYKHSRKQRLRMINWMKVGFLIVLALVILVGGGWFYLNNTDSGQRMMARMGRNANSTALWAVGEELMNTGDIEGAVKQFEKARNQDTAAGIVDVDGLLMLGNAYEASGRMDEAAALYEQIYTETPSRTEAYVNHIRILSNSNKEGDLARAAELMKTAYSKTGDATFQTQRSDLIPAPPEVDLTAGYYDSKKNIAITSYQGYDVYYTFDEKAELPSGGIKYTSRIPLDEGIYSLRAVAVNGELVSDELRGTYKIIMPSPQTPGCNLAPNAYKTRQKVRLRPGEENKNDSDIVIYYTVDGSNPDADSPIYTGEPVLLPSGHTVILKAVAVNRYNKVSNMLEVRYKIEAKPYPLSAWTPEESIAGLKLNITTMQEFQELYGTGTMTEEGPRDGYENICRKYEYDWGYAVMNMPKKTWVLVELYFNKDNPFHGPRSTNIGDEENYVVGQFRDLGQVEGPTGNRGLYFTDSTIGKIWRQEDGTKIIRYRSKSEGHWWQLEYYVNDRGRVYAVDYLYTP